MVEGVENAMGCKVQTFKVESGHCLNFTATEYVVDVVKVVSA